jgi:hypothetical protein
MIKRLETLRYDIMDSSLFRGVPSRTIVLVSCIAWHWHQVAT